MGLIKKLTSMTKRTVPAPETITDRFIRSLGPRNYLLYWIGIAEIDEKSPLTPYYEKQIDNVRRKARFHLKKLVLRGQITHEEADIFLRELLSVNIMAASALKKRVEKKILLISEDIYKATKIKKDFAELKRKYAMLEEIARNLLQPREERQS